VKKIQNHCTLLRTSSLERRSRSNRSHQTVHRAREFSWKPWHATKDSSRFSLCSCSRQSARSKPIRRKGSRSFKPAVDTAMRSLRIQQRLQSVETPEWRTANASAAFESAARGGISEDTEASPPRPPQSS
jgi:hypothetical protein